MQVNRNILATIEERRVRLYGRVIRMSTNEYQPEFKLGNQRRKEEENRENVEWML